jgi:hypothetical protein
MIRKLRFVSVLAILMAVLSLNLALPAGAVVSDTPCTDRYDGCISGGGGQDYCYGLWCGCMHSTYGYVCEAQAVAASNDAV